MKFHPDTGHDVSSEVMALLAQEARLLDDYDVVETEKRLHDWTIENYDPPKTIKEINAALPAIIYTKDNPTTLKPFTLHWPRHPLWDTFPNAFGSWTGNTGHGSAI